MLSETSGDFVVLEQAIRAFDIARVVTNNLSVLMALLLAEIRNRMRPGLMT
jgi:hypothetical protein